MRTLTRPSTARCTMPMYIAFLLSEPHNPSGCRLAGLMNISHDSVSRFLQRDHYGPKDLFDQAKSQLNLEGGIVSVDDTVLDKPYSQYIALVSHFWSGKHHRPVKGLNLITLYYTDSHGHHLPINYRLYDKTEGKTKNDYFLDMLAESCEWGLQPRFVTGDSWYSSISNLKTIKNSCLGFMFAVQSNRQVSLVKGELVAVSQLTIPKEGLLVWLREIGFVKVFRTTLKDEQRHYIFYQPEEITLQKSNRTDFQEVHDKHWQIEQYHRTIKQVCHIEHSQSRTESRVRNHVFAALSGYIHLQKMCLSELITNCYQLQRDLFNEVISEFIAISTPTIQGLIPEFRSSINA